jgi:hypothetical protein
MASIIIYSGFGLLMRSAVSMVTTELLMKSFKETTDSIYGKIMFLSNINDNCIKEIVKCINEIDLEFKLKYIDLYIKGLHDNHDVSEKPHIKEILVGIQEIVSNINTGLRNLENAIKHHNTKYFSKWRGFTSPYTINDIKRDNNILDIRLKLAKTSIK